MNDEQRGENPDGEEAKRGEFVRQQMEEAKRVFDQLRPPSDTPKPRLLDEVQQLRYQMIEIGGQMKAVLSILDPDRDREAQEREMLAGALTVMILRTGEGRVRLSPIEADQARHSHLNIKSEETDILDEHGRKRSALVLEVISKQAKEAEERQRAETARAIQRQMAKQASGGLVDADGRPLK